jgi:RNA polymerase sigma-70 factor (ECF subfamily)
MDRTVRESELVSRAVEGDAVALKLILADSHRHVCACIAPRIPAGLSRILDAEDIVQDAHVEVFLHINRFVPRGPGSFSRWVTAIALNRLRNRIKEQRAAKRGGRRRAGNAVSKSFEDSTIALLDMLAAPGKTPSRCLARDEAVRTVQTALAGLPENYRQAVWFVHIEGRRAAEVATRMGRTERAIHGLCRRGLELLRERIHRSSTFMTSAD